MAASRDLPVPLVILCLVLIRGCSALPTTARVAGMDPTRPLTPRGFSTEDFVLPSDDYYDDITVSQITLSTVSPNAGTPGQCNYKPCLEDQIPCPDLAASTGCLCPGFTPHNMVPEAPNLKSVSWNGSQVEIQWCAPNSYVTAYSVTVGGEERHRFRKDQRRGGLGDIDHISKVCVVAVNDAGDSEGACKMYHPRDSSMALKAGLIGGALGFLLLLLLGVLLWRHKRQRKQEASISMHDAVETQ